MPLLAALLSLAGSAACDDVEPEPLTVERPDAGLRRDAGAEPDAGTAPDGGDTSDAGHGPDLEGTPNLVIREDRLERDVLVRRETFLQGCDAEEYGIPASVHPLLRFTAASANVGDADVFVGDPRDPGNEALFEFSPCHRHYHFLHYMEYTLVEPGTGRTWSTAKRAFCLLDSEPNPPEYPGPRRADQPVYTCSGEAKRGVQGLSTGWSDVYFFSDPGQHLVLDGSDGQPPVPPGEYLLRLTVNPPRVPAPGETCRFIDSEGLCRGLPESSYDDNTAEVRVRIPAEVLDMGSGPADTLSAPRSLQGCHARPAKRDTARD